MAKPFKTLTDKMSPEARERAKARTREMLLEMNLQELRSHCAEMTQAEVAELLQVTQAFVSKFEHQQDTLVSTLYNFVKALGGELEILARFPGRQEVRVTQYEQLGRIREIVAEAAKG
jgi:predicted XRE-type DNA-binding protein